MSSTCKRAICERCKRPPVVCYCAALPSSPLYTENTRIVVLQDTREYKHRHSISSVPVLAQVLKSPECLQIIPVHANQRVEELEILLTQLLQDECNDSQWEDAYGVLVLYPHEEAVGIQTMLSSISNNENSSVGTDKDDAERPRHRYVLVVIDGTWSQAKKIMYHSQHFWTSIATRRRATGKLFDFVTLELGESNSVLGESLQSNSHPTKSIYGDLRKEPMVGCLSTLEAVAHALRALEEYSHGEKIYTTLCHAFRGMVSSQNSFRQAGRSQSELKYGPKPVSTRPQPQPNQKGKLSTSKTHQGVVRSYVFYTTETDVCNRKRLVRYGEIQETTRDQAMLYCQQQNMTRKRGQRISALPLEVFIEQTQQHAQTCI